MYFGRTTLSKFLIEQLRDPGNTDRRSDLAALLVDVAAAVKAIAAMTAKGALGGDWDALGPSRAQQTPKPRLDELAQEAVLRHCEWGGLLSGMVSGTMETPCAIPAEYARGPYLLLFEPLDRSSNIEVNVSVGSIFSVLRHPGKGEPAAADFLQLGAAQVAAGYALYGPSTMLVLTVGKGTHGFTLERETGNFLLTHPDFRIPDDTHEFAINASNERFWEPPVRRYVRECLDGASGVRRREFNMRWIASLLAQVHRVLVRGGVFLCPHEIRDPKQPGRLRLLFEANPLALLIEQAGGLATTGRDRLLDRPAEALHQRVPVILGSRNEVERIERYHHEFDAGTDQPYVSPLFNERSLFREAAGR